MSPVEAIFVPFPPKTGTYLLHPRTPQPLNGSLGPGLHVLTHPSRHRHALLALSKRRIDGAQWWVGDSGASVHGTGSMDHFYNTRPPTPEESRLIVGTGEVMQVKCIRDLDMVLHCDEDAVVILREVSFVPGLWYELTSFNFIQETEDIALNKTGRICFVDGCVSTRRETGTTCRLPGW